MGRKLTGIMLIFFWVNLNSVFAYSSDTITAGAKNLEVVEITERLYKDGPSIAIIFSEQLNPAKRYDNFMEISVNGQKVPGSWILSDNLRTLYFPDVEPETQYSILVYRGLTAQNGMSLKVPSNKTFTTKPISPSFGFASHGSVLPEKANTGIPVISINVEAVDIEFLRVKDQHIIEFMKIAQIGPSTDRWDLERLYPFIESVYMARFNTHGKKNKRSVTNIAVKDIRQLQKPGYYIAVMRAPGQFVHREQTSYFFVSDIGLHVRKYENRLEIIASSLQTAEALPDVEIAIYDIKGHTLHKGYTDAKGKLGASGFAENPFLVTGMLKNHLCFVRLSGPALDLSGFAIDGPVFRPSKIFVYSPRDLYRPGETIVFAALMRNFDGQLQESIPLNARINRPDGREVNRFAWQSEILGYYQKSFKLPKESPTGEWTLELRVDPSAKSPAVVYRFKVEDFLPERMKLAIESNQQIIGPNENLEIRITGQYLYGAPAAGNRLTLVSDIRQVSHPIEAFPEFYFGNPDHEITDLRQEITDILLDEYGQYQIAFKPVMAEATSPMRIMVSGSLYETGGRPVVRSLETTLWPAPELVGIRPHFKDNRSDADTTIAFDVIKTNTDGKLLSTEGLRATLTKEEREYYWEYNEHQGWQWNYSETDYPVYSQDLIGKTGGYSSFSAPVKYGSYRIDITDPDSGLTTRYRFYAGWHQPKDIDYNKPDSVIVSLDKAFYKPGETAIVTINPPHEGHAIVLVESNQLLYFHRFLIPSTGATVEIPIESTWTRHDIYITAIVLRATLDKEKSTPNRAMGVTHLPLYRNDRKIKIALDAPESMEPEKPLNVNIQIDNFDPHIHKEAYVTISAVDAGVLSITGFITPDPFSFFFARSRYGIDSYDIYGQVIETMEGVPGTLKYGGDGDFQYLKGGKLEQAALKIVSLFSGIVSINHEGKASAEFFIPDFNGKLKLMATVFTKDKFGSTEQELLIRAPVIVELATPRFMAAGDHSNATLDIHNLSGTDQQLWVGFSTKQPLKPETINQQYSLRNNEKITLRYPIVASAAFGKGEIEVSVKSDTISTSRIWELAVRPAYPGIIQTHREVVKPGKKFKVDPSMGNKIMENTMDVYLTISPDPPLNLENALKNLLEYPYGCLEQITSCTFPYLYIDSGIAEKYHLDHATVNQRHQVVEEALIRIAGMQNPGGGFSLWNSSGPEEPWLTPYVAHFLVEAREQGFNPPDNLLQKALERLDKKLKETPSFSARIRERSPELVFADKAYCAYVLARLNRASLGTLRTLFDHHRHVVTTILPLVHLGIALRLMGDQTLGNQAISEGISKVPDEYYYIGDYGSRLRETAMSLHLLLRHSIEIPDFDNQLIQLNNLLTNRRYFSPQEQNALFLCELSLNPRQNDWTGKISAGSKTETILTTDKFFRKFDARSLANHIVFHNTDNLPLYCSVTVSGYPKDKPEPETHYGMISREYFDLHGLSLENHKTFKSGDQFLVHLKITANEDIYNGLIVDLLPAGFEIENQNLAHSEKLDTIQIKSVDLKKEMINQQIFHTEFRDDRFVAAMELYKNQTHHLLYLVRVITPGTYQLPAPYMEDMYRPEIRAIGKESGLIVVESFN